MNKKVIFTFHGNVGRYNPIKNFVDKLSFLLASGSIVINNMSYEKVKRYKNSRLIPAFISPFTIIDLSGDLKDEVENFRLKHDKLFCTNANGMRYDKNNKEIYGILGLVEVFRKQPNLGLIVSDPSSDYSNYFKHKNIQLPNNILIIGFEHDFLNIIKSSDCCIRATSTDGDSLSIKEALFFNKPVICSNVVDRINGVILYEFEDWDGLSSKLNLIDDWQIVEHPICGYNGIFEFYKEFIFKAKKNHLNRLMAYSPHIELFLKRFYRSEKLNRVFAKLYNRPSLAEVNPIDFNKIYQHLIEIGVKKGDILIVHSAYMPLMQCGLKPNQIVDKLIELIGDNGSLVMPAMRKYPESPPEEKLLTADISKILFKYDVKKSKVWTGILPYALMKKRGAITSRFPLNTVTAYGPHAYEMIKHELDESRPAPNGINSAWKYCSDRNAWVISIGTDLTHSLTMIHTAEDVNRDTWPIKNWYREKKFIIQDGNFRTEKTVLERHPRWSLLHYAERTLSKELLKYGIMRSTEIEGIKIESLRSAELLDFLKKRNESQIGYPYFWVEKYLR